MQQFWFAKPDTEPIGVVHLVPHDTLQRYVLTLDVTYDYEHEIWEGEGVPNCL